MLLVLGNDCLRCMDGLSQHFTIQHESPDAVVVFAKTFPSLSSQTDPGPGVDLLPVLVASLRGEDPALHRFLRQGEGTVACEGCATVGHP